MNSRRYSARRKLRVRTDYLVSLALSLTLVSPGARGSAPEWLRQAARTTIPAQREDIEAVCLVDEQITTVRSETEIETSYRSAYRILRPDGRNRGLVVVNFDNETKLQSLKGWSIQANGVEYEVKEKEAPEITHPGAGILYEDTRYKVMKIPASEPGNVVGFEFVQRDRPFVLQDRWRFQDDVPVLRARYELRLPRGWEFKSFWANHPVIQPQVMGENRYAWELENVPAVEREPSMPSWHALAGRMAVGFFPSGGGKRMASWNDVGRWYDQLAQGLREATPEMRQKVAELTAGAPTTLDKIHRLAHFVQHDIRYVGIEIGIGSYQPHPAADVFTNRYGDCKDKVTLLIAMLKVLGVEAYYVLVNSGRGVVSPDLPSALTFNHAILAVRLPADADSSGLFAVLKNQREGTLLFFDPTDDLTQFSHLPPPLQEGYGLLVAEQGGRLVQLPLLPPSLNRLLRSGELVLGEDGTLVGAIQELSWGGQASGRRAELMAAAQDERTKIMEKFLSRTVGSLVLQGVVLKGLEDSEQSLILGYKFLGKDYAQRAGDLILVPLRLIGEKALDLRQEKNKVRKSPVEFFSSELDTDMFDIALPAGYEVDELPDPVDIKSAFGEYKSRLEMKGKQLQYVRSLEIRQVEVPTDQVEDLRKFFQRVATDERSVAVLKRVTPPESHPASSPNIPPR
jgi:hypothetical protein